MYRLIFFSVLVPSSKRRNLKQRLRNQELSDNPPLNNYEIHLVNKSTDINLLHNLIRLAQSMKYFTIDADSDIYTNCPALIQIEFIDQNISTGYFHQVSTMMYK